MPVGRERSPRKLVTPQPTLCQQSLSIPLLLLTLGRVGANQAPSESQTTTTQGRLICKEQKSWGLWSCNPALATMRGELQPGQSTAGLEPGSASAPGVEPHQRAMPGLDEMQTQVFGQGRLYPGPEASPSLGRLRGTLSIPLLRKGITPGD